MGTSSILHGASQGLQNSMVRMNEAAAKVAQGGPESDLIEPMVTMSVESSVYTANAQVIKSYDQVLGTLLDVTA